MSKESFISMCENAGCTKDISDVSINPSQHGVVVVEVVVKGKHFSVPLSPDIAIEMAERLVESAQRVKEHQFIQRRAKRLLDAMDRNGTRGIVISTGEFPLNKQ